jgi:outer membrane protein assembly factor BamB
MQSHKRLGALATTAAAAACLLLAACSSGGGGGDGGGFSSTGPSSPAPYILASLVSFPSGGVPPGFVPTGFNTGAFVEVLDNSSRAPIATASVSINGVALTYSAANQDYEGNIAVAPGGDVALSVNVGGTIYTASATQFTSYPVISTPLSGATWSSVAANLVAWSNGAPTTNSFYTLAVLDSADPNGQVIWPSGNNPPPVLSTTTTSFTINPNSITAGSRLVIAGILTAAQIPNAAPNSVLGISGFNYVPITVTNGSTATLLSIAVTPQSPTIVKGATRQFTATGTYSDNSTQDVTTQVTWTSSDTSKATISSTGLATGMDFGSATITATLGSVFGSTSVNVVTPLLSIAVTPSNPSIVNGTTVQLRATGTYSDSSTRDLTTLVIWSSSDNTKATVSSTGLVTAIATGSTTLTATSGNISGSTQANAYQPSTPSPDWVTFQGDTGHSGFVNAQFDPTVFTPIWSWSRPAGDPEPIGGINSVATTAGKVIVTKDVYFGQGAVYALNEADGTLNWTYAFGSMASEGPPAVWNGNVFVTTTDPGEHCVVWAIDAALGTYQFKMPYYCQWSNFFAPTALDGSVLQTYGSVYSYSIFSGGLQWEGPAGAGDQATPAADARYAYQYGIGNAALNVFDRITGATVASIADPFASASSYSTFSAPMLGATGDAIVFSGGGFSGRAASSSEQYDARPLVSYNISGKTIAWRSANAYLTHPAIANGVIYAARNAPATLDALSEADGHVLWSWTPPVGNASFHRNTVVTNNLVFVSTDANVYAIDLNTRQAVWHYAKPGMLAISGSSILYIATGATLSDGNLVAIKLK